MDSFTILEQRNKKRLATVTTDVNIANVGSVRISDKFMTPVREFFNEKDNCTERRYEIDKNKWLQQRTIFIQKP